MGVETRGAPADLPDSVEIGGQGGIGCRTGCVEFGALLEGVGGEVGGEGINGEGLVGGLDVEVEITPGAPPKRLKDAVCAAVGEEAVGEAEGGAGMFDALCVGVFQGVAIGFLLFVVVKGFGVGDADLRAIAAGDGEAWIGGGEGFAVKEQMNVVSGIYLEN